MRALTDQRVTATYLPDLVRAVRTLTERNVTGVVHVGSQDPLTRFEFAQLVAKVTDTDCALVQPATRAEMTQWVARRPADTTLNVEFSRRYGVTYARVEDALSAALSE